MVKECSQNAYLRQSTFLRTVGAKFGESERQSIEDNEVIVTEMKKPKKYAS